MSQENRKVLSVSERKNLQMVAYTNVNHLGQRQSITRFEPLSSSKPVYKRAFPKAPRRPQGLDVAEDMDDSTAMLQILQMTRDSIQRRSTEAV